jgi:hypothetical protein
MHPWPRNWSVAVSSPMAPDKSAIVLCNYPGPFACPWPKRTEFTKGISRKSKGTVTIFVDTKIRTVPPVQAVERIALKYG